MAYTIAFRPDYRPATVHRRIADALMRVEAGKVKRLMIFVPPRHGKSMLTSEHFPPWFLGRNPTKQIVCAAYGQELADDFGRKVRQQMLDPLYGQIFPECTADPNSSSVSRINTQQNGAYYAVGIGGALVGRGAHVLVIDDPVKDRLDADSVIMRKRAREWYQSVAYTRLMPGGAIVVMHTRWHEDDLAGWLLRTQMDEDWEILNIPAIPAPWPEAYPAERLDKIRTVIGAREWSAQYMQSPVPGGGGEFLRHWMKHYEGSPDSVGGTNKYILVDPAGEQRPENDFTSIWVVGLGADGNYYWLDAVRDRLSLPDRGRAVMRLHRRWKPIDVRYERYGMMGDIQYLRDLQNRENYRFSVTEVAGRLKKNDRIRRLLPIFEQGKFYAPRTLHYSDCEGIPRDLVHTFIEEEMVAFPAGIHDDMLDALARLVDNEGRTDDGTAIPLSLVWPQSEEVEEPKRERYARQKERSSVWAN